MLRLAIIADDLTGALDAIAPFAARGLRSVVAVHPSAAGRAFASGAEVVAINTASREIEAKDAQQRVADLLAYIPQGLRLFKKVDSRLKGNIEAELSAFAVSEMLIVPAIPEFGRVVVNGMLEGFGVSNPISIVDRLGSGVGRAHIPDVASAADISAALEKVDPNTLLVGARGLANFLAATWSNKRSASIGNLGARLSIVVGSRDPITMSQVDALVAAFPHMAIIDAPLGQAQIPDATLSTPALTLLRAIEGREQGTETIVAQALAASLRQTAFDGRDGLLVTGGATAEAVLRELEEDLLEVLGEILPGVPVTRMGQTIFITKSGGFGETDTLVRAATGYLGWAGTPAEAVGHG